MKVKIHSIMLGYKEAEARIEKDAKGRPVLMVEGVGPVSSLEYIKQGFKMVQASAQELSVLRAAGYPMRNELRP